MFCMMGYFRCVTSIMRDVFWTIYLWTRYVDILHTEELISLVLLILIGHMFISSMMLLKALCFYFCPKMPTFRRRNQRNID